MPKRTIFKLTKDATGKHIPLVGTVSAAYYNHSDVAKKEGWAAQLKLCCPRSAIEPVGHAPLELSRCTHPKLCDTIPSIPTALSALNVSVLRLEKRSRFQRR